MAEFVDGVGNVWHVRVDVTTIRRVRDLYGIDLAKIMSSQDELSKIADDVVLLVDTLYAVVKLQADQLGVNPEQFAHLLCGDAIEHGASALIEAIIDFFPQGRRQVLRQLWEKMRAYDKETVTKAQIAVEGLTFGSSSFSLPDTPE
jgi:hypothetical protein